MLATALIIVVNAPVVTNRTKTIELLVWYLRPDTEEEGVSSPLYPPHPPAKKKKWEEFPVCFPMGISPLLCSDNGQLLPEPHDTSLFQRELASLAAQ